jgi:hypothetical protein
VSPDGPHADELGLSEHVCEIPDADHGILVPGPLTESGRAHGIVGAAIERFLGDLVWPVDSPS